MTLMDRLAEERLIKKITWRILPIVIALYLCAIIDRSNIGFAKLQMIGALNLTETGFALGASFFFISYALVEVPSSIAAHRYGARIWFARIVFTWGLLTVALAWSTSGTMFYILRFLLGAAEGGLYPAAIYYLTLWFPQRHRVHAVGMLTLGSSFGNMFAALLGGPLLDLDGLLGFQGWQWVFIATGTPAVLMTGVVLMFLPNNPKEAKFLSVEDKEWLEEELRAEQTEPQKKGNPFSAIWDPKVLVLSGIMALINISLYGMIYWVPTVVKSFGATATQNGMLSSIPWVLAAILLSTLPRRLKTERSVCRAVACVTTVGVICFILAMVLPQNWMRFIVMVIGIPCISVLYPCFWFFPARFFFGVRAAASMGAISMIAQFGALAGQNLMPWVAQLAGAPIFALAVPATCLAILGVIALSRGQTVNRRDAGLGQTV